LAHGIGERTDLPLPGELVLQAGGFVVLVSFLLVGLAWRRPRFGLPGGDGADGAGAGGGRPDGRVDGGRVDGGRVDGPGRLIGQGVLLVLLVYLIGVAFAGPSEDETNPAPRALYVLLWVGLVPASLVFGPVWRAVNPLRALRRTVAAVFRLPADGLRPMPRRLAYHPAAAGLAVFVWLELVPAHHTDPPVVGAFLLGYAVLVTGAAAVYGEGFFALGDPFEVYSTLVGALAPARGNPPRALARITPAPGLVAVLAVWWGSTVFDGLSTAALFALIAVVAAGYRLATGAAASALVTTLVPIAVGYTVAHYASLLITEGPRAVVQLVHPGTEGPSVGLPVPVVIAVIQVAAVLTGHVLGVVAAHDRVLALAESPTRADGIPDSRGTADSRGAAAGPDSRGTAASAVVDQRRVAEQLPLVLLMIVYTMIGLYLLVLA
jgi:hypothetical protein